MAKGFLAYLRRKLGLDMMLAGLEAKAFDDPGKYITCSGLWAYVDSSRLPDSMMQGLLRDYLTTAKAKTLEFEEEGPGLDFREITAELNRRAALDPTDPQYLPNWKPRDEPLKDREVLHRFWCPTADDPHGAMVFASGCYCVTGEQRFVPWSEILGIDWVTRWTADRVGRAVDGIWFNESEGKFIYKNARGAWCHYDRTALTDVLCYGRNLDPKADVDGRSEVGKARYFITEHRSILGVGPLIYRPEGYYVDAYGNPWLNESRVKVLEPALEPQCWGPSGNFPWLSAFLELLIQPQGKGDHQFEHFISYWHHAYKRAYALEPTRGQVCFLAGPAGYGKTLFSNEILRRLFGGYQRADNFVTGRQRFNSQLFRVGLWVVDDSAGVNYDDEKLKTRYTEMIKAIAANPSFECEEKFRSGVTVEWAGRLVVTLNSGIDALRRLPTTDVSGLADKINLYVVGGDKGTTEHLFAAGEQAIAATIAAELPAFARWLLDWKIPSTVAVDNRFGVKAYQAPFLSEQAKHSSESAAAAELLDTFRDAYFKASPDKREWVGTATDLMQALHRHDLAHLVRQMDVTKLSHSLRGLKAMGYPIEKFDTRKSRGWRLKPMEPDAPSIPTTPELAFS